jgi:hypothetical protein
MTDPEVQLVGPYGITRKLRQRFVDVFGNRVVLPSPRWIATLYLELYDEEEAVWVRTLISDLPEMTTVHVPSTFIVEIA